MLARLALLSALALALAGCASPRPGRSRASPIRRTAISGRGREGAAEGERVAADVKANACVAILSSHAVPHDMRCQRERKRSPGPFPSSERKRTPSVSSASCISAMVSADTG